MKEDLPETLLWQLLSLWQQELPEDAIIVVSETEYTGAGKHIQPQLDFAREKRYRDQIWRP